MAPPGAIWPFAYGPHGCEGPEERRRLQVLGPAAKLQYYWDGPSLFLLSHYFKMSSARTPWLIRKIDRRILLPLWKKLVTIEAAHPNWCRAVTRLRPRQSTADIDIFHHTGPVILPLHEFRANVLTVYDLGTVRFPQFHERENGAIWNETLNLAPEMDGLVAISHSTKRELVELLGIEPDIIHVTPLAAHEQYYPIADSEKIRSVLSRYELVGQPYILHVGTLEPRKNLCRLVKAFHGLKQQEPGLAHQLLLVGEEGWMFDEIFETVHALHMETHVRWLNYVPFDDLPALLNGADLMVYPSLYEGFGLPPLEAMSCGTPVVASNTSSLPEVVGDAGILVDPERVEDLTAAMRRVLTDANLRATLRAQGLIQAKKFSWERTASLTLTAYEKVYRRLRNSRRKRRQRRDLKTAYWKAIREWAVAQSIENSWRCTNP
jgi:glycosyltransferase involved in cell wall biosynthesis